MQLRDFQERRQEKVYETMKLFNQLCKWKITCDGENVNESST